MEPKLRVGKRERTIGACPLSAAGELLNPTTKGALDLSDSSIWAGAISLSLSLSSERERYPNSWFALREIFWNKRVKRIFLSQSFPRWKSRSPCWASLKAAGLGCVKFVSLSLVASGFALLILLTLWLCFSHRTLVDSLRGGCKNGPEVRSLDQTEI